MRLDIVNLGDGWSAYYVDGEKVLESGEHPVDTALDLACGGEKVLEHGRLTSWSRRYIGDRNWIPYLYEDIPEEWFG